MKVVIEGNTVLLTTDNGKPPADPLYQGSVRSMTLDQYRRHANDPAFVATIAPADVAKLEVALQASALTPAQKRRRE